MSPKQKELLQLRRELAERRLRFQKERAMKGKLLTSQQARAVADAMAHLNNVGGLLHVRFSARGGGWLHAKQRMTEEVEVWEGDFPGFPGLPIERYPNQAAFLLAYQV